MMCQRIGRPADLDHRLRSDFGLAAHTGAEATSKDRNFHVFFPRAAPGWRSTQYFGERNVPTIYKRRRRNGSLHATA